MAINDISHRAMISFNLAGRNITRAQELKGAHLGTKSKYLIRFLKL